MHSSVRLHSFFPYSVFSPPVYHTLLHSIPSICAGVVPLRPSIDLHRRRHSTLPTTGNVHPATHSLYARALCPCCGVSFTIAAVTGNFSPPAECTIQDHNITVHLCSEIFSVRIHKNCCPYSVFPPVFSLAAHYHCTSDLSLRRRIYQHFHRHPTLPVTGHGHPAAHYFSRGVCCFSTAAYRLPLTPPPHIVPLLKLFVHRRVNWLYNNWCNELGRNLQQFGRLRCYTCRELYNLYHEGEEVVSSLFSDTFPSVDYCETFDDDSTGQLGAINAVPDEAKIYCNDIVDQNVLFTLDNYYCALSINNSKCSLSFTATCASCGRYRPTYISSHTRVFY